MQEHLETLMSPTSPYETPLQPQMMEVDTPCPCSLPIPFHYLHFDTPCASHIIESTRMLQEIKHQLAKGIQIEELKPHVLTWTRKLHQFLDMKLTLPLEERIELIQVYYQLIISPDMDVPLIEAFAIMGTRLLKCVNLLSTIDNCYFVRFCREPSLNSGNQNPIKRK
jgi:hypothetical protein